MKAAIPWVILALAIVGGYVVYLIVRGKTIRGSVTVGTPTFGGGDVDPVFVDSLPI